FMNYQSLFSRLSLTLLLQTSSVFLLSSCSVPSLLQQSSSNIPEKIKEQDNLTGIAKTIQDKAKQFTVRIDYPDGNGSGIIVAKNGETYYVLTAKHVVEQQEEYQIVTPDEKEHQVEPNNIIKTLKGSDLAVLKFQSGETYQLATLAEYKREYEEDAEKEAENQRKKGDELTKQLTDISKATSLEEFEKQASEYQKATAKDTKKSQIDMGKFKEPQYVNPWLFLYGWQRSNNTPQSRLTAGRDWTTRSDSSMGKSKQVYFVSQSFDSLARSQNYQLSYTNFSQGGMSGGPVMDTLGRVIGIHAAAEGERSGLEEIQLGVSFGIPTKTVLSSISQAGIKPEWLKVEKVRPQRITKADEQSITKNLLEIEPPGNNGTEADWLNYGNDLWRIKRYQEAIVAFDEAIKRKPDFYQAYFGKSLVIQRQEGERFMQKDSEKMLPPPITFTEQSPAEFQQEMEQHRKKMAETITSLSQKTAKALPFLKKATEIKPDFYPAWKAIGMIKFGELNSQNIPDLPDVPDFSGKSKVTELNSNPPLSPKATQAAQEALAAFNKATALNPSDSYLYWSKGTVLQDLSRHQEAIEAYTEAIKINPTAIFYDSRSKSYCAIGYEQKAEADLRNAEKLGSQNPAKDLPFCGVVTNLKLDDLIKYGN
ncbi:MAG: hypothetical protein RLZZ574_229, partial [Cyanobacteriota bacterium]